MQKKKIFVEIGIPSSIKKRLMQKIVQWKELPVKWMKGENLHITVSFIGYVDESVVPEICQKINEAVADFEAFEIAFDSIELGPNVDDPKIIWFCGKSSEELGKLNEIIEQALGMHPEKHKEFCPHITLGRIRKIKWNKLPQKPVINEKFAVTMTVESVSIMDSKGGGAEYISLEECPLV
jgi:2'-5' RNA ligase